MSRTLRGNRGNKSPSTLTRRFAPPSPRGRGNDLKAIPLPLGEGGAKRRVRVERLLPLLVRFAGPFPYLPQIGIFIGGNTEVLAHFGSGAQLDARLRDPRRRVSFRIVDRQRHVNVVVAGSAIGLDDLHFFGVLV